MSSSSSHLGESLYLFIYLFIHSFIYLSIYLFIYLFKNFLHTHIQHEWQSIISDPVHEEKQVNQTHSFIIETINGVGDGEEGHVDTNTRLLQCWLGSILFNLNLKLENLGIQKQMTAMSCNNQFAYCEKHKVLSLTKSGLRKGTHNRGDCLIFRLPWLAVRQAFPGVVRTIHRAHCSVMINYIHAATFHLRMQQQQPHDNDATDFLLGIYRATALGTCSSISMGSSREAVAAGAAAAAAAEAGATGAAGAAAEKQQQQGQHLDGGSCSGHAANDALKFIELILRCFNRRKIDVWIAWMLRRLHPRANFSSIVCEHSILGLLKIRKYFRSVPRETGIMTYSWKILSTFWNKK